MKSRIRLTDEMKYQLLRKISHELKGTMELEIIMNHILDIIQTVLPFDAGGIFVLNRVICLPGALKPGTMIGGVAQRGFELRPPEDDPMLYMGEGIIGSTIKTGESVLLEDVRTDPRYVEGRAATLSEIAVPIFHDNQTIGAVNLESDLSGAYVEGDLELLRFFADASSIAIEKSLLHMEIMEKKRIEEQLTIANEVQARLLPLQPPDIPGYDIDCICIPCHELGGDYFDFIRMDDSQTGIVVADVAGKGIPAALIMSAFRSLLRTYVRAGAHPAELGARLNDDLPETIRKRDFVAASYLILNHETHSVQYANFGNTPSVLIKADGTFRELDTGGPILGVFKDVSYSSSRIMLDPGDVLVMYTDGAVECLDTNFRMFGFDRLIKLLIDNRARSARDILMEILADTAQFAGSSIYSDDLTLVVIRRSKAEI